MLDEELKEIISALRAQGSDDSDVEAKRATDALPGSVRASLSAFSNTAGGTLLLGLDESRRFLATGVRRAAKISADLASVASDDMEPPLRLDIRTHRFEGVDVVVAEVPPVDPAQRPCYVKSAGRYQGSYVRVGDSNRRLSEYEIHLLVSGRGQPREDEELLDVSVDALNSGLVDAFVRRLRSRRPRAFADLDAARTLELAGAVKGDRLTLAGLLALGSTRSSSFPS